MMPTPQRSRQPVRQAWSLERFQREHAIALGHAVATSTNLTYDSALSSYVEFCRLHQFPLEPTIQTLCYYILFMSHHVKPTTISSYLSGIISKFSPYFANAKQARSSALVKQTLQGIYRLRGSKITRKRPITPEDLHTILVRFQASTIYDDILFLAMTWTGWHGLLRLSELTQPSRRRQRDYRKLMLRNDVRLSPTTCRLLLPTHKADQNLAGHDIILQRVAGHLDPISPFTTYLSSRDRLFFLFPELWLRENGEVPTFGWYVAKLRCALGADVGGSSLRSGGADYLAGLGTPHAIIQAVGRWSSEAFKVYLRTHPTLVQAAIWGQPLFAGPPRM